MPEPIPLEKHTLNLREGDFDYIDSVFRGKGVKPSIVIRRLVSRFVDSIRVDVSEDELLSLSGDDNG